MGRYQTEEQAKEIDIQMKQMLDDFGVSYIHCLSTSENIDSLVKDLYVSQQK